jgi:hypothetical protein
MQRRIAMLKKGTTGSLEGDDLAYDDMNSNSVSLPKVSITKVKIDGVGLGQSHNHNIEYP